MNTQTPRSVEGKKLNFKKVGKTEEQIILSALGYEFFCGRDIGHKAYPEFWMQMETGHRIFSEIPSPEWIKALNEAHDRGKINNKCFKECLGFMCINLLDKRNS